MGFYWDHVNERWKPIDHDRQLTPATRRVLARREDLIKSVLEEIEHPANSATALYAVLLAKELATSDELLARSCGERVAKLTKVAEPRRKVA
jgi:hypothetical protein